MTIYIVAWMLMDVILYFIGAMTLNLYTLLSQLLLLIGFLVLIFLGPHIQGVNKAEQESRKKFEEMANDIFKQPWLDFIHSRNCYYIVCFTFLAFMPFFYMFGVFWLSPYLPVGADGITPTDVYDQIMVFDIFLLVLVAGFSGLVLLIYTIAAKKAWYFYFAPFIYGWAFYSTVRSTTPRPFKNSILSLLLLIWPFFYLSKTSIYWSLPFLILIPPLFLA
jgi:hypothetical protein